MELAKAGPLSAKKIFGETRGLLARARNTMLQVNKYYEEQLAVEKGGSDSIKAQVTYHMGQMMKIVGILCIPRSKEGMTLTEVKPQDTQRCNVLCVPCAQ